MYGLNCTDAPIAKFALGWLESFKVHLRLNEVPFEDAEEALLIDNLEAAVEAFQDRTGRVLVSSTWVMTLDTWPRIIRLPLAPVLDVVEIRHNDTVLNSDQYRVDRSRLPSRVIPITTWPALSTPFEIEIEFRVGYVDEMGSGIDPLKIPASIKQAILNLATIYYEERTSNADIPEAFKNVCGRYKLGWITDMNAPTPYWGTNDKPWII